MAGFRGGNYNKEKRYYINHEIRSIKLLVIDEEGNKLGMMSKDAAIKRASAEEKDVVQIGYNPTNNIATVKIMDYGKFMYQQKKEKSAKKAQKSKGMKEIKFSYSIGTHDLDVKLKKAKGFLEDGYAVKFVAVLRGREFVYKQKAIDRLEEIAKDMENIGRSQGIKQEKMGFGMILFAKVK